MFNWIQKLLGFSYEHKVIWFVEGWDCEHDLDYETGELTGTFKTEQKAIAFAKKHYADGLWSCEMMRKA